MFDPSICPHLLDNVIQCRRLPTQTAQSKYAESILFFKKTFLRKRLSCPFLDFDGSWSRPLTLNEYCKRAKRKEHVASLLLPTVMAFPRFSFRASLFQPSNPILPFAQTIKKPTRAVIRGTLPRKKTRQHSEASIGSSHGQGECREEIVWSVRTSPIKSSSSPAVVIVRRITSKKSRLDFGRFLFGRERSALRPKKRPS